MKIELISSKDNPLFKRIRLLQASGSKGQKSRNAYGQALLEGIHLVQTWVGDPALSILITSVLGMQNPEIAEAVYAHSEICPATQIYQLDAGLWDLLSELANAPQIAGLLVLPQSSQSTPSTLTSIDGDLVILDRIQDAGNVGSILRTAAAAGFTKVLALSGCAHIWSSKVLRASMGAHRLLTLYEGWSEAQVLSAVTAPLLAATATGSTTLYALEQELIHPVAWIMGSEGQGVSPGLMSQARGVSIAIDPRVESLNVAVAAALCLFETKRVRYSLR
jgi:TrmH family RNA methyltransferase